jgi:rRNA maturation endonuclease Nob1
MKTLPYELKIHEQVDEESLDFVTGFSKETGDFKSLSKADLKVMALGVQL